MKYYIFGVCLMVLLLAKESVCASVGQQTNTSSDSLPTTLNVDGKVVNTSVTNNTTTSATNKENKSNIGIQGSSQDPQKVAQAANNPQAAPVSMGTGSLQAGGVTLENGQTEEEPQGRPVGLVGGLLGGVVGAVGGLLGL